MPTIDRVLFLSTAHIQQATDTAIIEEALFDLREHGARGKEHPGMPATMLFPCGSGFYGYLVWVDDDFKNMEISQDHPDLVAVIEYAKANGCQWIRFDCDGPAVTDLPTYEWLAKDGFWHRAEQP